MYDQTSKKGNWLFCFAVSCLEAVLLPSVCNVGDQILLLQLQQDKNHQIWYETQYFLDKICFLNLLHLSFQQSTSIFNVCSCTRMGIWSLLLVVSWRCNWGSLSQVRYFIAVSKSKSMTLVVTQHYDFHTHLSELIKPILYWHLLLPFGWINTIRI